MYTVSLAIQTLVVNLS